MPDPQRATYRYSIDADDAVSSVGPSWLDFAAENAAPELTRESVLGRPLWDFIAGAQTRHLYETLFERVRAGGRLSVPFRCDSPDVFRFMRLHLAALPGGGIDFLSVLLRSQGRPRTSLLDSIIPRADYSFDMCSLCKRIFAFGEWLEPEHAIARLGLFDVPSPPGIEYEVCDRCLRENRIEPRAAPAG